MGFREDLARKIERKKAEISDLESELKTARTYLQALEDMYRMAGRDSSPSSSVSGTERAAPSFRAGSMTGAVYAALKAAGRPLHINALLEKIGRETTRQEKSAVSGTLAAYVRKGEVFTRPAPNTFGLAEFVDQEAAPPESPEPPLGFGM